jgi:hypothetical protein
MWVSRRLDLPVPCLSQSVKVGPAVCLPDAENSAFVPKIGLREEGHALSFVFYSESIRPRNQRKKTPFLAASGKFLRLSNSAPVLDHLVVSAGESVSFREAGLL